MPIAVFPRQAAPARGFTVIELVVVITLLGIMSIVALSRFMPASTFNAAVARDTLISSARGAQQMAQGRDDVELRLEQVGDAWRVSSRAGGLVVRSASFAGSDLRLESGSTLSGGNCASGFDQAVTLLRVEYDGYGNAGRLESGAVNEAVAGGIRICVNDSPIYSVCISPGGFAHAGDCDD